MTFQMPTLDPIIWPADDEYSNPAVYRDRERFFWHGRIARELREQREQGRPACCVKGIAGNLDMSSYDVIRYLKAMITWGEVVRAVALTDFEPDTWVALAEGE